jgi:hypothetical protein
MASKTQVTERRRRRKLGGQGKARKRVLRRDGSTPSKAELFGDKE